MVQVVAERWGSLGHLAVSAASHRAAPSRAHLDSIRNRKRGLMEEQQTAGQDEEDGHTKKVSAINEEQDCFPVLLFSIIFFEFSIRITSYKSRLNHVKNSFIICFRGIIRISETI